VIKAAFCELSREISYNLTSVDLMHKNQEAEGDERRPSASED